VKSPRICDIVAYPFLMGAAMRLETDRLYLSTWEEGDWERFKPIATDPEVMHFITGGRPWTDDEIRGFAERNQATFQERGFCRWKLEEKTSGELIGFCGVGFLHGQPDPEIGWWLARRYWGEGLASEAALVAFQDAIGRVGLNRIISIADPANQASIRIMRKLGLRFCKHFEFRGKTQVMYLFERQSNSP
jgi:RimJ/RimL family protein N-acetyltransferase